MVKTNKHKKNYFNTLKTATCKKNKISGKKLENQVETCLDTKI